MAFTLFTVVTRNILFKAFYGGIGHDAQHCFVLVGGDGQPLFQFSASTAFAILASRRSLTLLLIASLPFRPWTEKKRYERALNAEYDKRHTKNMAEQYNAEYDHYCHIFISV